MVSEDGYRPSPFGFPIIVKDKELANPLIQHLEQSNIATRRMFGGNITRQPGFQNLQYVSVPDLDGANKLLEQAFWIGCHPGITDEDISYIAEKFEEFFDGR